MNWDAIGAVGEVVGAAGVIFTLLYLAMQIRQSNRLARFQTYRDIMAQADEVNRLTMSDGELFSLVFKAPESLTQAENERLYVWTVVLCNMVLNMQIAYDEGLIDEALLHGGKFAISDTIERFPIFRPYFVRWAETQPSLSEKFIFEDVRKLMDESRRAS